MKKWRTIVRVVAAVYGPIATAIWTAVTYLSKQWPMSPLEWLAVVTIAASVVYGIIELVYFVYRLKHESDELQRWLSIDSPQVEVFASWLRRKDPDGYGYQSISRRSLDDRMVAILEWWVEKKAAERPQGGTIDPRGPKAGGR